MRSNTGGEYKSPSRHLNSSGKKQPKAPTTPYGKPIEIIKGKLRLYFAHREWMIVFTQKAQVRIRFQTNFCEFIHNLTLLFSDKLYWISDAKPPQNIHNAFFFNIDNVSQPEFNLFRFS